MVRIVVSARMSTPSRDRRGAGHEVGYGRTAAGPCGVGRSSAVTRPAGTPPRPCWSTTCAGATILRVAGIAAPRGGSRASVSLARHRRFQPGARSGEPSRPEDGPWRAQDPERAADLQRHGKGRHAGGRRLEWAGSQGRLAATMARSRQAGASRGPARRARSRRPARRGAGRMRRRFALGASRGPAWAASRRPARRGRGMRPRLALGTGPARRAARGHSAAGAVGAAVAGGGNGAGPRREARQRKNAHVPSAIAP